jgi:hypothetical protein
MVLGLKRSLADSQRFSLYNNIPNVPMRVLRNSLTIEGTRSKKIDAKCMAVVMPAYNAEKDPRAHHA